MPVSQEDLGGYDKKKIAYAGWWTNPGLSGLGDVSLLSMPRDEFLHRCKTLYKPFEELKERRLQVIVDKLGVPRGKTEDFRSLKLLATICQVAHAAVIAGLDIVQDQAALAARWDGSLRLLPLRPLFALNELRQLDAHQTGTDGTARLTKSLAAFGIDPEATKAGWGQALDVVYDTLKESLAAITSLLRTNT